MSSRSGRLIASFTLVFTLVALYNFGCVSDNYKLGNDDRDSGVAAVKVYRAGAEISNVHDISVKSHVIIEGRALNETGDYARDASVTMVSTDEKILKILNNYVSNNSFFSVVQAVSSGTAEIIVGSAGISVPIEMSVSATASGDSIPYIVFKNNVTNTLKVGGAAVEYTVDYVTDAASTKETSFVWTLLPQDQTYALIASRVKNTATVIGLKTGEVDLQARDAENTAAAAIHLIIN